MRTNLYSFDTHGFFFACKLFVVLALCVTGVRFGGALVFGEVFGSETSDTVYALDPEHDSLVKQALARINEGMDHVRTFSTSDGSLQAVAIADFIPKEGTFLGVDLTQELLTVYHDGLAVQTMHIRRVPQAGTPDSIPTGLYAVLDLEREHFSQIAKVYLPDRIRFEDRFSIHGPAKDVLRAPVEDVPLDGSIELEAEDAARLFDMVDKHTTLFVLTENVPVVHGSQSELALAHNSVPALSARSFELADAITGEVYLEKNADKRYPIASVTKLMTALVAHGSYDINEEVRAPNGERYVIGDLYYPLLLRSDNGVAHAIAAHGGTPVFLARMNTQARALGMYQTSFSDSSGISARNTSTAHDLSMLAKYLYHEKRFLLDLSSTDRMTITSSNGVAWNMTNQNKLAPDAHFLGGKLGYTDAAGQTSLALFTVPVGDEVRVVSIIILNSRDWKHDTRTLIRWFSENVTTKS